MPDISQITINDTVYDIKDVITRSRGSCWYGTCSTAPAATQKVVICSDFTLSTGAIVGIKFTSANTAATPSLNINSTGAKSIYVGTNTLNSTTNVLKWSANTMLYFMYDGTYFRYIGGVAAGSVVQPDGAGTWYGTSSTTASTATKTATVTNFRLTPGALVAITFSTANTVSNMLTLNINSTGGKTIFRKGTTTSPNNVLTWQANDTLFFIYSGSYWYYLGGSSDESGYTLPAGGSAGQVLSKNSASDYDVGWVTPSLSSMPFCKYRLDSSQAESGTPSSGSQRIVNFALGLDSSDSISSSDSSDYFEMTSDGGMKCLQAGIVEISGSIYFSATNMQAGPYIYKNTDEVGTPEYFYSAYSNPVRQIAGIVTNVAANDVIYMKARSTDGAKYTGNRATYLLVKYLEITE